MHQSVFFLLRQSILTTCTATALMAIAGTIPAADCPSVTEESVVETMRKMYAAATVDDEAGLSKVFDPDFYAYDVGKRFSGHELYVVIKDAHAAGKKFVWTVADPQVHVHCDWAWITYVNRGSVSDATGMLPVTWLESAVLRYDKGSWFIRFFHSTRSPTAP